MRHTTLLFALMAALLLCLTATGQETEIYKTTDAQGNVVFTDAPTGTAEVVKLKPPSTYEPALKVIKLSPSTQQTTEPSYQSLIITAPLDGTVVRQNNGALRISYVLSPPLATGHKVILLVDAHRRAEPSSGSDFALSNLDRGRHQFQLQVISAQDQRLIITSAPVTATLMRHSIRH